MTQGSSALWALSAAAPHVGAPDREVFARWVSSLAPGGRGWIPLVTCQRVELFGAGERPYVGTAHPTARVLVGPDAIRHLARLAVGLESAAVGEGQVLHQVRAALASPGAGRLDPVLVRTWQVALRAGWRARSGRGDTPKDLGDLAVGWLRTQLGALDGRRVLVVGAGPIGVSLARAARAQGAVVTVATRMAAAPLLDLEAAAAQTARADGVAVALRGPWTALEGVASLPPTVDLSFPGAVPLTARSGAAVFADIDALARGPRPGADDAYRARAERLVDAAVEDVERWLAARPSSARIRVMRERADAERRRALDRLFRRLPELDPRERALVTALSEQLVAGLLHRPTEALGRDVDGSAAAACDRLFGA